jgi:hypothetical protein
MVCTNSTFIAMSKCVRRVSLLAWSTLNRVEFRQKSRLLLTAVFPSSLSAIQVQSATLVAPQLLVQ